MGLALFARSTRSLGLTEAGRRLHARTRAVREAAESATAGFGRHVLASLLARFQVLQPAVRHEPFFTDRRVDLLREWLDIAFRVMSKPPDAWVAQPVLRFAVHA